MPHNREEEDTIIPIVQGPLGNAGFYIINSGALGTGFWLQGLGSGLQGGREARALGFRVYSDVVVARFRELRIKLRTCLRDALNEALSPCTLRTRSFYRIPRKGICMALKLRKFEACCSCRHTGHSLEWLWHRHPA